MYNITMPPGGQTTDESLIVKWHKQVGDKIERGDILFEIETDKATLEVESYCEGYLRAALYGEGEKASTGEIVAYIGKIDEEIPGAAAAKVEDVAEAVEEDDDEYQPILKTEKKKKQEPKKTETPVPERKVTKPLASPRAKKAARDYELNLADIPSATGIIKEADVLKYKKERDESTAAYESVPLTGMRKVIARRMCESVYTAPHYNISVDIDMTECIRMRKQLNAYLEDGMKITFNDFIIKCAAKAIEKYPMINASFGEDEIRVYKDVNAGLAVGMDRGLVVPVVFGANKKSLLEIARENKENVKKAKDGKLKKEEMSGGTITVSNLGMFGVNQFTAVINQPESCILAVGAILEKAVSINREIVSRDMMTITGSFDHRVIDGALGAQFLQELKKLLEAPQLLLL